MLLGELVETALYQKLKKMLNLKLQMNFKENQSKALPYLIPVIFIVSVILTSFGIHQPADVDVIFYYNAGYEILHGDASNVYVSNGGIGWPVTLAFFTDYVGDVLIASKSIALIASGLIIFITFFIIRNVFGQKIALLGQIIIAVNPLLHVEAIITHTEMLPVFLIFVSFYFITKEQLASKELHPSVFNDDQHGCGFARVSQPPARQQPGLILLSIPPIGS